MYTKAPPGNQPKCSVAVENVGRTLCAVVLCAVPGLACDLRVPSDEAHSYLWHIIKHYNNLADWTVFSQAAEPRLGFLVRPCPCPCLPPIY